jgi:hypothetical protein
LSSSDLLPVADKTGDDEPFYEAVVDGKDASEDFDTAVLLAVQSFFVDNTEMLRRHKGCVRTAEVFASLRRLLARVLLNQASSVDQANDLIAASITRQSPKVTVTHLVRVEIMQVEVTYESTPFDRAVLAAIRQILQDTDGRRDKDDGCLNEDRLKQWLLEDLVDRLLGSADSTEKAINLIAASIKRNPTLRLTQVVRLDISS